MKNHDYYPQNPPEPTAYIIDGVYETDPNDQFIYAVEEHLYEQRMELDYFDIDEISIQELIQDS